MLDLIRDLTANIPLKRHKRWHRALRITAIITGFLTVIEFLGIFIPETYETQTFLEILTMFLVFLGIFVISMILMTMMKQQRDRSRMLLARFKGEDEMSIKPLAKSFGIDQRLMIKDFNNLLQSGDLKDWYIDYSQGRFFNRSYYPENIEKAIVTCPNCGADNVLVKGIIANCSYCNTPLEPKK